MTEQGALTGRPPAAPPGIDEIWETKKDRPLSQKVLVREAMKDDGGAPPWRCAGPDAGELVALPFGLSAVLEYRCEAKLPNSCIDWCDQCWAARRRVAS